MALACWFSSLPFLCSQMRLGSNPWLKFQVFSELSYGSVLNRFVSIENDDEDLLRLSLPNHFLTKGLLTLHGSIYMKARTIIWVRESAWAASTFSTLPQTMKPRTCSSFKTPMAASIVALLSWASPTTSIWSGTCRAHTASRRRSAPWAVERTCIGSPSLVTGPGRYPSSNTPSR